MVGGIPNCAPPDIHQCSLHYLTRLNSGFGRLMLEMQYHISINLEFRMTEIAVYVLSALRLCSASNSAWLDNLLLSSSANPRSI